MRGRVRNNEPPPIKEWYRYRVLVLVGLSVYCVRFGLLYTPFIDQRFVPPSIRYITAYFPEATEHWEPVWILGMIWFAFGVVALFATVTERLHNVIYIAATMFTLYFAGAYLANGIDPEPTIRPVMSNDFFTAALYLIVGGGIAVLGLLTRPSEAIKELREAD